MDNQLTHRITEETIYPDGIEINTVVGHPLEPLACTHLQSGDLKTVEAENSRRLVELLTAKGLPDPANERAFQSYRLSQLGLVRSEVSNLLDRLLPLVTQTKSPEYRKAHRDSLRKLVYALGAAGYAHEWLVLPMQSLHYAANQRLGKLGLSRRHVKRIIDVLASEGLLVRGRKGYRFPGAPNQGKASQFYPSRKLMEMFAGCLYEFEDEFEVEVYRFKDFPVGTEPAPTEMAEEIEQLTAYNHMMRKHSWARKGPTSRVFSESLQRGGRLINGYQNIVKRRVPIRTNTLIDGYPVVEVDFSANHLRMIAALNGIELPQDPYGVIAARVGISREVVKAFTTVALGVRTRSGIGKAMKTLRDNKQNPITKSVFHRIQQAFEAEYPWISEREVFFNDTGARMQVFEGGIAMRVISEAVRTGRPVLAVHDAFAVREQDRQWVRDVMREAWKRELSTSIEPVIP